MTLGVSVQGQALTTTNAMGNYQIVGVNPGNQGVTASIASNAASPTKTKQVAVVAGQTAQCDFDF